MLARLGEGGKLRSSRGARSRKQQQRGLASVYRLRLAVSAATTSAAISAASPAVVPDASAAAAAIAAAAAADGCAPRTAPRQQPSVCESAVLLVGAT